MPTKNFLLAVLLNVIYAAGFGSLDLMESAIGNQISLNEIPKNLESQVTEDFSTQINYSTDFTIQEDIYIVGPGDLFEIFIEKKKIKREVTPAGKILLKEIGEITVDGLTLKEAKKKLLSKIKESYTTARSYVSLVNPKTIRVFVTGAVNNPGVYEIKSNHRLTEVLRKAQWFRNDARKSLVSITPKKGSTQNINIKKFLVDGDLSSNPYISQGSIIKVPYIDYAGNIVTVRHRDWNLDVQIEESETISDVILKFNSYQVEPPRGKIIIHDGSGEPKIITAKEASSIIAKPNSLIEVPFQKNEVYIGGAVRIPGFRPYNPEFTIAQYISQAGLLTSSKLSKRVSVLQSDGEYKSRVSLSKHLSPGDAIIIKENMERKFLIWGPTIISLATLTFAILNLMNSN